MSLTQGHRDSVARGYEIAASDCKANAADLRAEGRTAEAAQAEQRASDALAAAQQIRNGGAA